MYNMFQYNNCINDIDGRIMSVFILLFSFTSCELGPKTLVEVQHVYLSQEDCTAQLIKMTEEVEGEGRCLKGIIE